jgi:uncharacterized protein YjbI with pentapeptide repeats
LLTKLLFKKINYHPKKQKFFLCIKMGCKSYIKRSTVESTVTLPKNWTSNPWINRSTVESCTFENLTEATVIHRSMLGNVNLRETLPVSDTVPKTGGKRDGYSSNGGSYIKFSHVKNSTLTDSNLKRCNIQDSTLDSVSQAKWCKTRESSIMNVPSLKRCDVIDTVLDNVKCLQWSTIKQSHLKDCAKIKRSTIQESNVQSSIVDHASLTGCKANNCAVYRTSFEGMHIENGIWKHGSLVGPIDDTKEVICEKIVCLILCSRTKILTHH